MKYATAIAACLAIFVLYLVIGGVLGWRHGGGFIPMMLLLAAMFATWRGLTKERINSQAQATPSAPLPLTLQSPSVSPQHQPSIGEPIAVQQPAASLGAATGAVEEATTAPVTVDVDPIEPSEAHWAQALAEFDSPGRRPGLWAKCFAEVGGVEPVAKALYLQERAKQLLVAEIELRKEAEKRAHKQKEAEAFRRLVGQHQAELIDNLQFIEMNATIPIQLLIRVVRMLGGTVDWGTSGQWGKGWRVSFNHEAKQCRTDRDLISWFQTTVLPGAKSTITLDMSGIERATCPNCGAVLQMGVPSCLGCDANFGPDSNWSPIPIGKA